MAMDAVGKRPLEKLRRRLGDMKMEVQEILYIVRI
jgi:hypothetical protein